MKSPKLSVEEFGVRLLETEDLDPLYCSLYRAGLERQVLFRWLMSYWMFYHAGLASQMCDMDAARFWEAAFRFNWPASPRGVERRHFRGQQADRAMVILSQHDPVDLVESLLDTDGDRVLTFDRVSRRVQAWPMFGPWIAWKVCDMLERVARIEIDFLGTDLSMYRDPVVGAQRVAQSWGVELGISEVCDLLLKGFTGWKAPPTYDRVLNIQEIETILCKVKSHWNGHYYVGKDIVDLREAMIRFPSDVSGRLLDSMPQKVSDGGTR